MLTLIIPQGFLQIRFEWKLQTLPKFMEPRDLIEPIPYHPFLILKIVCVIAHISHQPHDRPVMYSAHNFCNLGLNAKSCKISHYVWNLYL
jgi:hypothetical protein